MSTVKVESRPGLGNVLLAAGAFEIGEAVVQERPLLHVPQLKPSNPLYKPLQAYFEAHRIPASVVLKLMAFVTASTSTQASVLRCFCPDTSACEDAAVVQQAFAFAACLLQHPPVPEFAEWAASQCSQVTRDTPVQQQPAATASASADDAALSGQQQQQQLVRQQNPAAFDILVRVWLIWVMNGHNFKLGSALFDYGSKLTHTCAGPNTMYRTATGDIAAVVESVDGSSSSAAGSTLRQPPLSAAGGASAAGLHVALVPISTGDLLTTNYLGMGHKRVMSTPARQKYLQDKFLFRCTCSRCTQKVDVARGIPCPACSGPFRSEDKLLTEHEALADWQLGQSLVGYKCSTTAAPGHNTAGTADAPPAAAQSSSSSGSDRCGYIYCSMAEVLAGADAPWKCDTCGVCVANDTAELWGRFYTRSHATIENEMEGWVNRLDESLDSTPLVRNPSMLHERVLGVLRLLGPRHWASWRLLLLGIELHCGAMEEALMKLHLQQKAQQRAQQAAAAAAATTTATDQDSAAAAQQGAVRQATAADAADLSSPGSGSEAVYDPAAAENITRLAVWVVRYSKQLWSAVADKLGEVEAGQVLGHHFSEASQVLLQVASSPGKLPQATATGLVDAALQLQLLVLPGLRSIMGPKFNPLAALMGEDVVDAALAAGGGQTGFVVDAAAIAAAVRRQQQQRAAEARGMMSLVQELKQLEAKEGT